MRCVSIIAACGAIVASPVAAQSGSSADVARDVQCFILYAAAAGSTSGDEQVPGLLGTAYFVGKLKAEASGLDLVAAAREGIKSLQSNPDAKSIGSACDKEIAAFSTEMKRVGGELQQSDQPSSSSS